MFEFVIELLQFVILLVQGLDGVFLVCCVYCIGWNYVVYVVEMGYDFDKELLFFFQKNLNNLDVFGLFVYLFRLEDVYYEIELVVVLKLGGWNILIDEVFNYVYGYVVFFDMIWWDLQGQVKKMGWFWEIGKVFEVFVLIILFVLVFESGYLVFGMICLIVNGDLCQEGDFNQMIWKIFEMILYLFDYFELVVGDVILIGILVGVGFVVCGDMMEGIVDGLFLLKVVVV